MIKLVTTISAAFDKFKKRIVKIRVMGLNDIQTSIQSAPFGVDSNPIKDMIAVYAQTGEMGKTVIVGYLNKDQLADIGETRLYSTDKDGVEKTYIWLKNDGVIEIGGSTNFMVKFNELQTAFNELQNKFNNHVHTSNGSKPTVGSSANIALSKADNVKTK